MADGAGSRKLEKFVSNFVMLLGSKFIAYGSGERLKSVFAERMRGNMWR